MSRWGAVPCRQPLGPALCVRGGNAPGAMRSWGRGGPWQNAEAPVRAGASKRPGAGATTCTLCRVGSLFRPGAWPAPAAAPGSPAPRWRHAAQWRQRPRALRARRLPQLARCSSEWRESESKHQGAITAEASSSISLQPELSCFSGVFLRYSPSTQAADGSGDCCCASVRICASRAVRARSKSKRPKPSAKVDVQPMRGSHPL